MHDPFRAIRFHFIDRTGIAAPATECGSVQRTVDDRRPALRVVAGVVALEAVQHAFFSVGCDLKDGPSIVRAAGAGRAVEVPIQEHQPAFGRAAVAPTPMLTGKVMQHVLVPVWRHGKRRAEVIRSTGFGRAEEHAADRDEIALRKAAFPIREAVQDAIRPIAFDLEERAAVVRSAFLRNAVENAGACDQTGRRVRTVRGRSREAVKHAFAAVGLHFVHRTLVVGAAALSRAVKGAVANGERRKRQASVGRPLETVDPAKVRRRRPHSCLRKARHRRAREG